MRVEIRKYSYDTWKEIPGLGMDSSFKRFKTWATNSGRAVNVRSTGRVQYRKWKLFIRCPMLTAAQFASLRSFLDSSPDYFSVRVSEDTGTVHTLTMYAGDLDYGKEIVCGNSEAYYQDVSVDFVEE